MRLLLVVCLSLVLAPPQLFASTSQPGRLYLTFVDVDGDSLFCASTLGVCIGSIDAVVVWQAEFTAGLLLRF